VEGGSLGHCVENYIRETLIPLRSLMPISVVWFGIFPPEDPIPKEQLNNQLFCLQKEQGIDAFALKWSSSTSTISVHCAQIKVGALGSEITSFKQGKNSMTVPAILDNFKKGSRKLVDLLRVYYPDVQIVFETFSLITTKTLQQKGKDRLSLECEDCYNQKVKGIFLNIIEYLPNSLQKKE
jgi:hypothetical protein